MLFRAAVVLTTLIAVAAFAAPAHATEISVTTTEDQGNGAPIDSCSLRNAVLAADRDIAAAGCSAGGLEDFVDLPSGTYVLNLGAGGDADPSSGDIDITGEGGLTIRPASKDDVVTIVGGGSDRIFDVATSPDSYLDLRRLNITSGSAEDGSNGGAILMTSGNLKLFGTTIFGNEAEGDGGGIFATDGAVVRAKNSTFAFNEAWGNGGAVALGGGHTTAELQTTTIAKNTADVDRDGRGDGGGFSDLDEDAFVSIENSILARNTDRSPDAKKASNDCASHSFGFQPDYLVTTATPSVSCPFLTFEPSYPRNRTHADPHLVRFGFNGGPTRTFSIGPGSAAIGAAAVYFPDHCPRFDQRGTRRPAGLCDAGSFQYSRPGSRQLESSGPPTSSTAIWAGNSVWVKVSCPPAYKPVCHALATIVIYPSVAQKALTFPRKFEIPSGKAREVRFRVRAGSRSRIEAMTHVDRKRLYLRQAIYAERYGRTGKPGWNLKFTWYKVRIRN